MAKFKELRKSKGLTQTEIAEILNIPRSTYSRIENEIYQADYDLLKKISTFYKVSINYILDGAENDYYLLTKEQFEKVKEILFIITSLENSKK